MEVLFDIQPEPLVETRRTDRENLPAYQMLPGSARRVFAAIERTIGNGSSASFTNFRLDHHIGRQSISPSLKLLDHLGQSSSVVE
jgi:hypothetical protein